MKDSITYDVLPTSTAAVVQQRAAASVRRHVPDLDGRRQVLAALGLPRELAEDPPAPGVADGYRALAGAVLARDNEALAAAVGDAVGQDRVGEVGVA